MKILILDKYLAVGGVATFIKTLAEGLMNKGHSLYLVTGTDGQNQRILEAFKKSGMEVLTVPYSKNRLVLLKRFLKPVFNLIKQKKIDIIHSQHRLTHFAAITAGKRFTVPRLLTMHTFKEDHKKLTKFWKNETITVPSKTLKNQLINHYGLNEKAIHVIHNTISPKVEVNEKLVSLLKRNVFINPELFYVTYIGRLSNEKGIDVLLESIALVAAQNTNIAFRIFGDGCELPRLKQQSLDLDIDPEIIFRGATKNVNELLSLTDLCVLPSRSENFSLFILESLRLGKPVLATNVGGTPEIIKDGQTGILVEPNNPGKLAKAILSLYNDEFLLDRLAKEGCEKFRREFSADKFMDSYIKQYEKLIAAT